MARAIVLQCDQCESWDSEENKVQTIGVAGPRFDLCAECRASVIEHMGVDATRAQAYVAAFDRRKSSRGAHPGLGALESQPETEDALDGLQPEAETAPEAEMDDEPVREEDEVKPVGRRASRK